MQTNLLQGKPDEIVTAVVVKEVLEFMIQLKYIAQSVSVSSDRSLPEAKRQRVM